MTEELTILELLIISHLVEQIGLSSNTNNTKKERKITLYSHFKVKISNEKNKQIELWLNDLILSYEN
ncbi:uncharacterized protein PRCAT00005084001 [Priceomyces carsonii]|uniref:uncharacterized protein n=1 Tax=Priceomyces carsonii TaxID=28549 RepID=UPI002ED9E0E3|nr:unnamed protein product [Priceomyces carsonii]